jgi:hypothetical protein
MSVNADILNNNLYEVYQWYVNGSPIQDAYSGILQVTQDFVEGSVYSVNAYTTAGDEVRICGQTARAAASAPVTDEPALVVSPNPASLQIAVSHPNLGKEAAMVRIYSMSGSLVISYPVDVGAGNSAVIDISMLAAGQYIIRVFNSATQITKQ